MLGTTNISTGSMNNLSISINGTNVLTYNGKESKNLDISLSKIGAASISHNHDTAYSKLTHGHDHLYSKLGHTHEYLPLAGGELAGNLSFTTSNNTFQGIYGIIADSDYWRIGGSGVNDNGYLEIATCDNGTEPIYVRQYADNVSIFTNILRSATLLDANGNTSFPGSISEAGTLLSNKYAAKSHDHGNYLQLAGGNMTGKLNMLTNAIGWSAASDFAMIHFNGDEGKDNGHLYVSLGDDDSPSVIFRWMSWATGLYTTKMRIAYDGIHAENGTNYYIGSQVAALSVTTASSPSTNALWAY